MPAHTAHEGGCPLLHGFVSQQCVQAHSVGAAAFQSLALQAHQPDLLLVCASQLNCRSASSCTPPSPPPRSTAPYPCARSCCAQVGREGASPQVSLLSKQCTRAKRMRLRRVRGAAALGGLNAAACRRKASCSRMHLHVYLNCLHAGRAAVQHWLLWRTSRHPQTMSHPLRCAPINTRSVESGPDRVPHLRLRAPLCVGLHPHPGAGGHALRCAVRCVIPLLTDQGCAYDPAPASWAWRARPQVCCALCN